ncbi:MAG TPA: MerR family transcriptional regulator [Chitinophagaceae bacterium]|nr:MerR family transcriptional regulator [Chitinophagaceae bacterium]
MNAFTIRDLEKLSGVKAHTIRIWEQRYSFLRPQRTSTNIRYYSNEELKTVLNIALLNKYGFKISHIDRMNKEEINARILSLNDSQAQLERIVHDMIARMVDMDVDGFEALIDQQVSTRGIEKTITQIIFPFLEKVGILWLTERINPAQEHLVTNLIRQKLIAGIESTVSRITLDKTLVLFLPEGEYHELGLLYMHYLLKSRGARVIYLGANVPLKDVEYLVQVKKPDLMYIHMTSHASGFNFEKFLAGIEQNLGHIPLVISGPITQQYKKQIPPSVLFKKSLSEVMEFLASL